jgi:pilus assembly protein CpaB
MRNTRALMMILLSLIAGITAVILASRWLASQNVTRTNKVAVAVIDIGAGAAIRDEHFRLIDWPASSVPAGAFQSPEKLKDRVAKQSILRDEPVLESKLAPIGTRGGLSAVIAQGKRAITVRVNEVIGVAGFTLPGNLVDVIVSTKRPGREQGEEVAVSKIVLEKILVLSVGQEASRDETKPKVVNAVTLEVTPQEAEILDLARSVGTLSLVLRNQVDVKDTHTAGATKNTLLGIASPKADPVVVGPAPVRVAARPGAPARICVDALVGNQRTTECS